MSRVFYNNLYISLLLSIISYSIMAKEPISPIPQKIDFDYNKAKIGKRLFFDPGLSKDGKVACISCQLVLMEKWEPKMHQLFLIVYLILDRCGMDLLEI